MESHRLNVLLNNTANIKVESEEKVNPTQDRYGCNTKRKACNYRISAAKWIASELNFLRGLSDW